MSLSIGWGSQGGLGKHAPSWSIMLYSRYIGVAGSINLAIFTFLDPVVYFYRINRIGSTKDHRNVSKFRLAALVCRLCLFLMVALEIEIHEILSIMDLFKTLIDYLLNYEDVRWFSYVILWWKTRVFRSLNSNMSIHHWARIRLMNPVLH